VGFARLSLCFGKKRIETIAAIFFKIKKVSDLSGQYHFQAERGTKKHSFYLKIPSSKEILANKSSFVVRSSY